MEEDYILHNPIFIEENLIFPLYNEVFSKELERISEMLANYISDEKAVNDTARIVSEMNRINDRLLQKHDFDAYMTEYQKNCQGNHFAYPTFVDVNPDVRFYWAFDEIPEQKVFIPENNEGRMWQLYRKMMMMDYNFQKNAIKIYREIEFISLFIAKLVWGNHSLTEEFRKAKEKIYDKIY